MNCPFSEKQQEIIKEHSGNMPFKAIADTLNKKFKTSFTRGQVANYCRTRGLTKRYFTNPAIPEYIRSIMPLHAVRAMELVNKEFGTSYCLNAIYSIMQRSGIKNGLRNSTEVSGSIKPIHSERIDTMNGRQVIHIKTDKKWELKHRYIWEQANGEIPKGNDIMFLDGNSLNCNLENLCLVFQPELRFMHKNGLITEIPEATETGLMVLRHRQALINKITKGMNEREKKNRMLRFYRQEKAIKEA